MTDFRQRTLESQPPAAGFRPRTADVWILCLLLLAAAIVFGRDITRGGLRYSDACSHAMDGVLIHDWIASGPSAWIDPIGFATRQYSHFQTLGIGRVYPPGFAMVESAFFAMFGVSAFSARLCVLSFGLTAVAGTYFFCRRVLSQLAAVLAAAMLMSMPGVVFWTRQTMLEMPTLAVCIWTAITLLWYLDRPGWKRLIVLTLLVLACPFFKQTGVFMLPVVAIVLVERAVRGIMPWRHFSLFAIGTGIPFSILFWFTFFANGTVTHVGNIVSLGRPISAWLSVSALVFYPQTWLSEVGQISVVLCVAGAIGWLVSRRWSLGKTTVVLWLAAFFAMSLLIQHKEPRYFFVGYFPMAVLAASAAEWVIRIVRPARVRISACCAAAGFLLISGYRTTTMIQPDYTPIVSMHADRMRNRLVLFEGHRDGDFVFAARRVLGPRGCVVLRASKLFYTCAGDPRYSFVSIAESSEEIRSIIASLGLETIVIERGNDLNIGATAQLHAELRNADRYELVTSWPFSSTRRSGRSIEKTVDVFDVIDAPPRRMQFIELPIPIASTQVRVDLDELLGPRL